MLKLLLELWITKRDANCLLTIEYQHLYKAGKKGKKIRNILSVCGMRVDGNHYATTKKEEIKQRSIISLCNRMCNLGIMNTVVSSWGTQETDYVITTMGLNLINRLKSLK